MEQAGDGDSPGRPPEGVSSRLPWRYSPPGRRQLLSSAAALRGRSGGNASGKAGGGRAGDGRSGSRPTGAGGGTDIDEHIRLAVREESAANLGRAGARLQAAVAALADHDGGGPCDHPARAAGAGMREVLLQDAAVALWEYVVQREAVGLVNHELVSEIFGVTPELWRRMGSTASVCSPRRAGKPVGACPSSEEPS
jgi:hypothetical protein